MPASDLRTLVCAAALILTAGDANAARPVYHPTVEEAFESALPDLIHRSRRGTSVHYAS